MKHTRKKSNETKRHMLLLPVFLVAMVALVLGAAAPEALAHGWKKTVELEEAEVFIEYNSTDGDFGIQFFWDGDPWKWMMVKNERRRPVLSVWANKNVKAQGLTEGFFESAEPTVDELSLEKFLERFPEGDYTFRGRTLEREWLVGEAELTHNIPCPPDITVIWNSATPTLSVSWIGVMQVVDLDEPIPEPPTRPECNNPPDDSEDDDCEFEIVGYEVVFEVVIEVDEDDERVFVDTVTLTADATSATASPEFVDLVVDSLDDVKELKVEVIAQEGCGNKTITEDVLIEEEE